MKTYIALLRGINVGGNRKVLMAKLRELLTKIGFSDVRTYIQSGNVIFQYSVSDLQELEDLIQKAISKNFGFDVLVLVKTQKQLETIMDNCPFSNEKKENSYFALLTDIPNQKLVNEACNNTYDNEEYHILNDCIYLYCANGYGKAKFNLNYFERNLKVNATARNYKTMLKLLSLSAEN